MKYLGILSIIIITASSCTTPKPSEVTKEIVKEELTLEEKATRQIELELSIPSSENYSLKIYLEHLDGDKIIDAIITVNRLDNALKTINTKENPNMYREMGYMGRHNFIFYYDGAQDKISPAIPISSSPFYELKVEFLPILGNNKNDVIVDYRIRNSQFRDYLTINNHAPRTFFHWNVFDNLGTKEATGNVFTYVPGSYSDAKDILIYKAKVPEVNPKEDLNKVEPSLLPTTELLYQFFYNPKDGKYYTKNK